jgi:dihydroorotase-like cyclic amidohydrolase
VLKGLLLGMVIALPAQLAGAEDLLIRHALMIDGAGHPPAADVDILIEGDRIQAIGPSGSIAAQARVLDATGMSALPA